MTVTERQALAAEGRRPAERGQTVGAVGSASEQAPAERQALAAEGRRPAERGQTVWLTGLPSAGKSTIARALEKRLLDAGERVEVLDGDVVREHLTRGLGFSREDRDENVRRIGFVANLLSRNGVTVICPVIAPYRSTRAAVRASHEARFVEVHVSTPVDVCSERDVKGLYARQRAGELSGLTGVDDPYEPPLAPEVAVPTQELSVDESVDRIWQVLQSR
ncbi:MAG TPA: adenylyl-sulfate kinase [Acidimicrobiales bacterium]|nr:adenylyl-sulfate kinase [Acidimicrobiales bacterium]